MRPFPALTLVPTLLLGAATGSPTRVAPIPSQQAPASVAHRLLPLPATLMFTGGRMPLRYGATLAVTRFRDARLDRALDRFDRRLMIESGLNRPMLRSTKPADASTAAIVVSVAGAGEAVQSIAEDESYELTVSTSQAVLSAHTVVGALRGLETLLQLIERDADGNAWIPAVRITDRPRFAWRGLLIDVARHFEPIDVLERNLDAMAAVKMNVFHWHLSEDQGFRVESKRYPKLQSLASDRMYYTQAEMKHIVEYARDRGIRVVPEFDMPGHSVSWLVAYPQYAGGPGPFQVERRFGGFEPIFDPTSEATYRFIDRFVGEMTPIFPDHYWHVGGDEVNPAQWKNNPAIQKFMARHKLADPAALQAYFNRRVQKILARHKRRVVGWDEILHPDLPKDIVVQSWRGVASLSVAAKQGYDGILSAPWYLDAMKSAGDYYVADPLPANTDLTPADQRHVLGGEVCMWAELITWETIETRVWPRTAAVAERFWSPQASTTDVADMYRRLDAESAMLERMGLRHVSGPESMLRDIAGGDAEPLRRLQRLVQPLSLGERMRARARATQETPLNTFGDYAMPDPPARRELLALAKAASSAGPERAGAQAELSREFREWRELKPRVAAIAARVPRMSEADTAATIIADLAATGDEAIQLLARGSKPTEEWLTSKKALIDRASKPVALMRIAVTSVVSELVDATIR